LASQRTLGMSFALHSWAGIVTGLLMFIVCFSGAVVVFKHEIDLWANPSLPACPGRPSRYRWNVFLFFGPRWIVGFLGVTMRSRER
jgi:uncharacterized iron-regulated membrane protein